MTYILMTKGLKQSVCDQSFYNGPVSKFWAYAFVLSKAPELGKLTVIISTTTTADATTTTTTAAATTTITTAAATTTNSNSYTSTAA